MKKKMLVVKNFLSLFAKGDKGVKKLMNKKQKERCA